MPRVYGNLTNRIEEGKNYNSDKQIHVGDDITMYWYSDRTCYYVVEVISQKHIVVAPYQVCADHSKPGGMGHQNWLYFKTRKEENDYLKKVFPEKDFSNYDDELRTEHWVFRNNKWKKAYIYTKEDLDTENMFGQKLRDAYFTERDVKKLESGKEVYKYASLSGKVSFGIRDFYHDWEF